MSETLNFGPEWLRALSTGAGVSSPPPSPGVGQFKLAEYRYGREEMLALFRKTEKLPPELTDFHSVVRKECQSPMSLMPLTDEEQRSLSQCVNSTVAIRATGRGGGGTAPPSRGRGVSRGRGRGRVEYQRSMTYEEEGGFPRREYNRTMSWDDSHEHRFEKGHRTERTFEEDPPASPRKIIERDRGSASDNWRNPRADRERSSSRFEDEEGGGGGWRRAGGGGRIGGRIPREGDESWRQGASRSGWHQPRERTQSQSEQEERDRDRESGLRDYDRDRGLRERQFSGRGRYSSLTDEATEEVPEWTLEDDTFDDDEVGVFDASGSFTAVKKSELEKEEREQERREQEEKEKREAEEKSEAKLELKDQGPSEISGDTVQSEPKLSTKTEFSPESSLSNTSSKLKSDIVNDVRTSTESIPERKKSDGAGLVSAQNLEDPLEILTRGVVSAALNSHLAKETLKDQSKSDISEPIDKGIVLSDRKNVSESQVVPKLPEVAKLTEVDNSKDEEEDQLQHLEKAAEDLMAELITEEDDKLGDESIESESQLIPTPKLPPEEDPPVHALPPTHENAQKWFYKDPQGQVQGPFTSAEMMEWFRAGYFTMTLHVKQGVDEDFNPLGLLIKRWNRVPFLPAQQASSPVPPQMLAPSPTSTAPVQPQPQPDLMPPATQLTEQQQWQKLAEVRQLLAQKKQQQLLQQQQQQRQQHAFQTLLHQQQSLIRVQASRIYQELIQRGKTLTPAQQQVLYQQLKTLHEQNQMLLQQQQNWHRVQQALTPTPSISSTLPQTRVMPKPVVSKEGVPGGVEEMQISVWDPVPTEKSKREWSIGVWDPEMAKDITDEERAKRLKEEEERRRQEEEQEKVLREQEEKMREEERRKIEELQAKRIEEELRRHAEEEQRILEEMRKQESKMVKEEEAQKAALSGQLSADEEVEEAKTEERKSPAEKQMEEELKKRDELKKLEESHQKKKEDAERQRKEEEARKEEERLKQEAKLKMQQEATRKVKEEQERARREQEERELEAERQKLLRMQENQRQQEEAMRRMQQAPPQPQAPLLPSSAMWAQQSLATTPTSSTPTLAQIQQIQQQQEERERQERQRQLQLMHQQQQQQQQQQAMQSRTAPWGSNQRVSHSLGQTKSLREIQEEQARQQMERQRQSKQPPNINLNPVVATGAWGNNSSNHHLAWGGTSTNTGGVWGDHSGSRSAPVTSASSMGFWDDAQEAITRTSTSSSSSTSFPSLRSQPPTIPQRPQAPNMKSRMAREEENVHRLFQNQAPSNEFSQWCEITLQSMGASVDKPTFIAFLQEVESAYEVHDYIKTYLGESRESSEFGRQFLERRARYKDQQRKRNEQMGVWITSSRGSNSGLSGMGSSGGMSEWETEAHRRGGKIKKKNRMQPVDPSILGFSVNAAERINSGEIQTVDDS